MIEEKVSADLIRRSDWEDEASQRQAVEKRLEKCGKAVETAVEKSEKEKDQAKAQKCEAWLASTMKTHVVMCSRRMKWSKLGIEVGSYLSRLGLSKLRKGQ